MKKVLSIILVIVLCATSLVSCARPLPPLDVSDIFDSDSNLETLKDETSKDETPKDETPKDETPKDEPKDEPTIDPNRIVNVTPTNFVSLNKERAVLGCSFMA